MSERSLPEDSRREGRDLDEITGGWEFDPTEETANVRAIIAADGAEKIQLRIRFGMLQLFADGSPETGGESMLEKIGRNLAEYRARKGSDRGFSISALSTAQISQELIDYYQRRVCFFLLGDYRRAMRDAEHNLDLIRLLKRYSVDDRAVFNHDRYRAFILMDRARASAMIAVEEDNFDRAVAEIDAAIAEIREFYKEYNREDLVEQSNEIEILEDLKVDLRKEYNIPMSRSERIQALKDEQARAVAREDYEKAARLRDEIDSMEGRGKP